MRAARRARAAREGFMVGESLRRPCGRRRSGERVTQENVTACDRSLRANGTAAGAERACASG